MTPLIYLLGLFLTAAEQCDLEPGKGRSLLQSGVKELGPRVVLVERSAPAREEELPLLAAQPQALALLLAPPPLAALLLVMSYLWFRALPKTRAARPVPTPDVPGPLAQALAPVPAPVVPAAPPAPPATVEAPVEQVEAPMTKLVLGKEYSGGEIVVEALRLAGVERLFGIPGVQNLALYNAICSPETGGGGTAMHLIGNEEAAAYMAWGVWHEEQRLGCACLIGGPGVTHALAGVACASRDRTPMVVLTAGVRAGEERYQLHDVDNLAVLKPVCKGLFRPTSVEEIGSAIGAACQCALEGRQGPVGVEIACDLYNQRGIFTWDLAPLQVHYEEVPPSLSLSMQESMSEEPLVALVRSLSQVASSQDLALTLVAEPGHMARAAVAAASCRVLCPGCGARPSGLAAENPGVAVPCAIAVARCRAWQHEVQGTRGLVVALSEALLPQGLELSHAQGLPLLVVAPQHCQDMAKSMGMETFSMASLDEQAGMLAAVEAAAAEQTSLLALPMAARSPTPAPAPQQQPSACRSLVDALTAAEVRLLLSTATNPGQQRLLQTLERAAQGTSLEVVSCTDSQSVGFVADGAARCFAGQNRAIGACLVDAVDAFALPTLSGVGEAWQDGVAMLLIVLSPQEEDHEGVGPLAEFSKQIINWKGDVQEVQKACELAATPPCAPVTLVLPRGDFLSDGPRGPSLLSGEGPGASLQPQLPQRLKAPRVAHPSPLAPQQGAAQAVEMLLNARRPWIHVGMGCAQAGQQGLVECLADTLEAPVSSTFSGKGVLREDHPLWLWVIAGPAMPQQLREVVETCDVVLILGAQMGEIASCRRQWPARRNKVIHVDADPCVLGANFSPDLPILADCASFIDLLLEELRSRGIRRHRRPHDATLRGELREAQEKLRATMRAEAEELPRKGQCSPFGLYGALQGAVPPDAAVFVSDSGNGTVLGAEFLRLAAPRQYLAPTDFSSMGYCIPAALGAALAGRARGEKLLAVATVGDGAFLMTGLEMVTALALKLPVICVILRDGELGMISGLQRAQQNEVYCTHVPERMDMRALGAALGLPSRRVTSDHEAVEVAQWAYEQCSHGPVLIEAMVCYGGPSFYARGATGQQPTAQVAPRSNEPLPLARLPVAAANPEARDFARKELERHQGKGSWDVGECLRRAVEQAPDMEGAVEDGEVSWSYAQLAGAVESLRALLAQHVKQGDRVGLMLPNSAVHLAAHYAVTAVGLRGVALNLSPRLQPPELLRLLEDAAPRLLVCHAESALLIKNTLALCEQRWPIYWSGGLPEGFEGSVCLDEVMKAMPLNAWPKTDMDVSSLPCEMYFTSGTSGRSKGVLLSHQIVHSHALHCIAEHRFTSSDIWLHVAPMFHLVDAFAIFAVTAVGGKHLLLPHAFDAAKTLEALQRATATNMATSMVNLLLASPLSRSMDGRFGLRLVSCGGAPLGRASLLRAQRLFGCEFFQSYGMTECCGKISMSMVSPEQRKLPLRAQLEMLCSSGQPFEGIQVRVADVEKGSPVPSDGKTVGEVQIRGKTVFTQYLGIPASSEHFLEGGWFRTGDLAYVTPLGFLQVIDRLKDMILVGSENVYCIEVENALAAHPAVSLCSVYGVPGPEMIGELVKAVILLKEGMPTPSTEEFQSFCSTLLADFKIPRVIEVVKSMPLNSSGKVLKSELKKRDREAAAGEAPAEEEESDLAEHCYEITFRPSPGTAGSPVGQWLVLPGDAEEVPVPPAMLEAISGRFAAVGAGGTLVRAGGGDVPVLDLVGQAPTGLCVVLPSGSMGDTEKVRLAVQRGICSLMAAAKAAEAFHIKTILVASQHAEGPGEPLPKDPALAACWSFCRAAAAESSTTWRLLELCHRASSEDVARTVVAEAVAEAEEVAWACGRRYVPRLQRLPLPPAGPTVGPEGGSCIVVGGNGSLGRLLVARLLKSGQFQDVVVVSRRPGQVGEQQACRLHMHAADAADLQSCGQLMRHVRDHCAPCSNILNLAGFLPESGMVPAAKDLRWADCAPVLRPKVDGSLHLATTSDEVFGNCKITSFSSIFGVLSYPRLAPYGAANGFQDGFSAYRRLQGYEAQAIAWGAWAETGMAHRAGQGFQAFWASEGMGLVPPADGMKLLEQTLRKSLPPQLCIFPVTSSWPAALSRHVVARELCEDEASQAEEAEVELGADLRETVENILATLLGCEVEEVPMDEPFATAGITSMMAVDLTSRVGKALSISLPPTLAFEVVSGEQLVLALSQRLKPKGARQTVEAGLEMRRAVEVQVAGASCVLPGGALGSSTDLRQMWQRLLEALDCIRLPPKGRPCAAPRATSSAYETLGYSEAGYLDASSITEFDASAFGMSAGEAEITDPQQRLCVRCGLEALEDAAVGKVKGQAIGVYVGVTTVDFTDIVMTSAGPPSAYTGPALTTAICSNRVSYIFDLQGPSASVDTACSSSLVCGNMAMSALRAGSCTGALVMGVNVQFNPYWTEAFAEAGMLSPTGRCRFGDDRADGYVRGEGCSCLMLMESEAQQGLRAPAYATLRGSFSNQDGRSNGLTAPNPMSQAALLTSAWQDAGLSPSDASYAEAHGTGTSLGDPIEIVAMGRALRGKEDLPVLRTTSFKSNIGHLECGAGAASLTKLVLVLQRAIIPPSLHLKVLNRHINWEEVQVRVVTECERLQANASGCVSGFGFGGSNANAVLSSVAQNERPSRRRPVVLPLAGDLQAWADDLTSLARAAALRSARPSFIQNASPERLSVVAGSVPELLSQLNAAPSAPLKGRRMALLLCAEGREPGAFAAVRLLQAMLVEERWPALRRRFQELEAQEVQGQGGAAFTSLLCATACLVEDLGISPRVIMGHGLVGEAACLTACGVLQASEGMRVANGSATSFNSYWPPATPAASAQHGMLSQQPTSDYFKALNSNTSGVEALQELQIEVVVEVSIAAPPIREVPMALLPVRLGPPSDGRIVSGDVAERGLLAAAAALHVAGAAVDFARAYGAGPVARLPPPRLRPRLLWPTDPAKAEWRREVYAEAYEACWLPLGAAQPSQRRHFLISGSTGHELRLAAALVQQGAVARVGAVEGGSGVEYVWLAPAAKVQGLRETLDAARSVPYAMLQWLQSLPAGCHAAVVSEGAHASEPQLSALPVAAMWGAARSARLERSDISLRCVDVEPGSQQLWSRLAAELLVDEPRDVLLDSARRVRVLRSLQLPRQAAELSLPEAFVLTGGTGALGLMLGEWLAGRGVKNLILVSRSGQVQEQNQSLWRALQDCRASVELVACDLAENAGDVAQRLPQHGGLAHLAGVLHDGFFKQQSLATLDMTMKPKVDGAALLVDLVRSQGKQLDQCWLFSSVTSCLGNLGQTAYGAANGALDAMAVAWAARALQWGPWADFGMASAVSDSAKSIFRPWKSEQALEAMGAALGTKCPVICLTQFQWPQIRSDLDMAYYRGFLAEFWQDQEARPAQVMESSSMSMRTLVRETLQKFLPNGTEGLTDEAEFDELGLDSLSGVEASRALGTALAAFGITGVKPTFLFEANCLNAVMAKLPAPKQVMPTTTVSQATGTKAASPEDVKQIVVDTLKRFLPNGTDGLTDTTEFDELGLDSLSGVEASRALGTALAAFGITGVKPTFLFEANCLNAVMAKLPAPKQVMPSTAIPQPTSIKAASPEDVRQVLVETLKRFLPNGTEGLTDTTEFDELGLDSLSGVEASRALAAALTPLGLSAVKPTFLFEANTIQSALQKLPMPAAPAAPAAPTAVVEKPPATVGADVHSVGTASAWERFLFAGISSFINLLLRILSAAPAVFLLAVVLLPMKTTDPMPQPAVRLFSVYILTCLCVVSQVFMCMLLGWMAKNLLLGKVTHGMWPIWGWKMACFKGLKAFEDFVLDLPVMTVMSRTELPNVFFRVMGAKIGRGAYISKGHDVNLIYWDLLSVGEDSILDGPNVAGANHTFHIHRPLSIGNGCVVGHNVTLKAGAKVNDGAVVLPQCILTGEVPANGVHDGGAQTASHLRASDMDAQRVLITPRRTPLSLSASLVAFPFIMWLKVLSYWPFIVDFTYLMMKYLPLFTGGPWPNLEEDLAALCILSTLMVLSSLIYEVVLLTSLACCKWLFLGRLREGNYSVSFQWLFAMEFCMALCKEADFYLQMNSQTIFHNAFLKAMGGDISWAWMPSPLNYAAYLFADLLTFHEDSFTASFVKFNPLTLASGDDAKYLGSSQSARWQMSCRRIVLGPRSFAGPWTCLTGGCQLGEGAATNDQTYVPPGALVPAWRTLMGTSVDGRSLVKRRNEAEEAYGMFPYAPVVLLVAMSGRIFRSWSRMFLNCGTALLILRAWGQPLMPLIFTAVSGNHVGLSELGGAMERGMLFLLQYFILNDLLVTAGFSLLILVLKHGILGRVTPSSGGPLRGWENLKWVATITNSSFCYIHLKQWSFTPLFQWIAKASGGDVGQNVQIYWRGIQGCPELDMVSIGDDVCVGGALYCHKFSSASLSYSAVRVGAGAHAAGRTMLAPGATMPPHSVALEGSVLIPGSADTKMNKQYIVGNPAISQTEVPENVIQINGKLL